MASTRYNDINYIAHLWQSVCLVKLQHFVQETLMPDLGSIVKVRLEAFAHTRAKPLISTQHLLDPSTLVGLGTTFAESLITIERQ